ncbi:MAG: tetratricopeptide repeat protein [bacterium]|nr:tetratricopeptide repeat protein [bacterium]
MESASGACNGCGAHNAWGAHNARCVRIALRFGLALTILLGSGACLSGPALVFQGARHYATGSEALRQGDGARALSELQRAAELVPHASEIRNHLGLAYLHEGERARAREAFARALELDCENAAARLNLAGLAGTQKIDSKRSETTTRRAHDRQSSEPTDVEEEGEPWRVMIGN